MPKRRDTGRRLHDVEMIVASPLARGTMGYKGIAEKDVYDVLADVKRRFSVDDDRVYLTGLSMGGGGALWIGLTRPDVWAAIAPVCPAVPAGTEDLAANGLNVPMKIFQGAIDPVVPAVSVRQWHKRLVDAGVKAEYIEYPGIRHNSWDVAYKDGAIFTWFAPFKRERNPDHVTFSASSYRHGSAYWVRFDNFTPGVLASIDARFTAKKRLAIQTKELDGFTLRLKDHPMAAGPGVLRLTVDGVALQTRSADAVSLSKTAKGWSVKPFTPAPDCKALRVGGADC